MNAICRRTSLVAALTVSLPIVCLFASGKGAAADGPRAGLARHVVDAGGVTRGVCAVLGLEDGSLPVEIARGSGLLVHALDDRAPVVASARRLADRDGLWCRRVVVEAAPLGTLPYADNTIDLVVAVGLGERGMKDIRPGEVLRVLRPGGKAILGQAKGAPAKLTAKKLRDWLKDAKGVKASIGDDGFGTWARIVKPPRAGVDSWSHWYRKADNNPVSTDAVIKAPYMAQWYGRPYYIAMPSTTLAAGGRIFLAMGHIAHHKREWVTLNTLVARNGYNGAFLWRRKLPEGYMAHRSAFIATDEAFYMIDGGRCLVLEPETGRQTGEIRIPKLTEKWEWIALEGDVLYVLSGKGTAVETTKRARPTGHWSWGHLSKGYYSKRWPRGFGNTVSAYDVKGRRLLWQRREKAPIDSRAMTLGGGKLFLYCPDSHIACLNAASGSLDWACRDEKTLELIEQPGKGLTSTPGFKSTCFTLYTPEVIFFEAQTRMNMVAVSTYEGKMLWHKRKTTNNPNPIYVDGHVVVGIGPGGRHLRIDPVSGKVLKDLGFAKRSCTRLTATPDSFFVRGEGLLRYDRKAEKVLVNGAVRAGCNDGAVPANGLLYVGPWLCDCNLSLMGTVAMCSAGHFKFDRVATEAERLQAGPGPADRVAPLAVGQKDWPTYRANNDRSAGSKAAVPQRVARRWRFRPDSPAVPTVPVAAGGLVFLAGHDGKVRAVDAETGKQRWSFLTAGPILMPPTVAGGRAFVGSGDGYVYTLEATTGRLLWRFRAAPVERRIMVYGTLGSTWPVNSGVLVADGVAYFAAGIIDTDGTYVYALDAATGKIKWQNNSSGHLNAELRKGVSAHGSLTILGNRLILAGGNQVGAAAFDLKTGKCLTPPPANGLPKANRGQEVAVLQGKHLIHGGRLLYSAVEKVTSPAMFNLRMPGRRDVRFLSGLIPPAWTDRSFAFIHGLQGRLTCCDPAKVLEASARKDPPPKPSDRPRRRVPTWAAAKIRPPDQRWSAPRVTGTNAISLAVAANAVLAICQPPPPGPVPARPTGAVTDRPSVRANPPVKAVAAAGSRPKWILVALGDEPGRRLWHEPLPSPPLPGGLIVDRAGQTIVACQNGDLICFGKPAGE